MMKYLPVVLFVDDLDPSIVNLVFMKWKLILLLLIIIALIAGELSGWVSQGKHRQGHPDDHQM